MLYQPKSVSLFNQHGWLLLLLSFLLAKTSPAQNPALQKLIGARDDTVKVNSLLAYAQTLLNKDHKSAKEIYQITYALSKKLDYKPGMATSLRKSGFILGQEGNYREGIENFREALLYLENGGVQVKDQLVCYNSMGAGYCELGLFDSAMHFQMLALSRLETLPIENEDFPIQKEMLAIKSQVNVNISAIYINQQNAEKALEYSKKAWEIAKNIQDTARMSFATSAISQAYYIDKDYEESLFAAKKAMILAKRISHPTLMLKGYHLLSINYTALNNQDSAIFYAEKCLTLANGIDQRLYLSTLIDLADIYHYKKAFTKEASLLNSAMKELKTVANLPLAQKVYEKFAVVKYELGNYKEAYDLNTIANSLKDSMNSAHNRKTVAELDIQYQTAQKEKTLVTQQLQLAQKNLHLQQSRQHVVYSVCAFLFALFAAGFVFFRYKHNKKQHGQELLSIHQQQEMNLLMAVIKGEEKERSRIAKDLHDGVSGMLAAVKMHFSTIDDHNVLQKSAGFRQGISLLNEAYHEIRKTAHNLMPEVLLSNGLDAALQRYCANIENAKMEVQYDSWGDLKRYRESFELAVYRIAQELLHNVVKHSNASQVIVQMNVQENMLSLTIEDNGIGFQDGSISNGTGIINLKKRVQAMNGRIDIDGANDSGVSIYIEFDTTGLNLAILKDGVEVVA